VSVFLSRVRARAALGYNQATQWTTASESVIRPRNRAIGTFTPPSRSGFENPKKSRPVLIRFQWRLRRHARPYRLETPENQMIFTWLEDDELRETRVSNQNHQGLHYARKLRTVEEVNVRSLSPLNFKTKFK
jgi:hypothetical protein